MNAKPHRQNSTFQLRYFLAGDCKTPDGAWTLLYGQKIDMEGKLRHVEVQRLRREAKIAKAQEVLDNPESTKSQKLEAQADILEQDADQPVWELNCEAAKQELQDILDLMAELEPLRKYSHLPLLEATEASQREEWLEELKTRAENYMVTQGTIPHDHLNTMRMHPDFEKYLSPFVQQLFERIRNTPPDKIMTLLAPLEVPSVRYEGPQALPLDMPNKTLNYGPRG